MSRIGSKVYDLKSFAFISLCAMFVGVAAVAGQFDSTNSGTGSGGQRKLFSIE